MGLVEQAQFCETNIIIVYTIHRPIRIIKFYEASFDTLSQIDALHLAPG